MLPDHCCFFRLSKLPFLRKGHKQMRPGQQELTSLVVWNLLRKLLVTSQTYSLYMHSIPK